MGRFPTWTGKPGAKVMWRFTLTGGDLFCFAGLWDRADTTDGTVDSFTILTCPPGPDCAPYHDRQPVVLEPGQWAAWLDLTADAASLLKAGPAGTLRVERATAPA